MIKKYDAFISYRHIPHDKAIVEKLQYLLEHYRPPKGIECKNTGRIERVFVDQTELPTSGDLAADIKSALENSEYLIVICSEETKKSVWCMQEIDYFKELHNGETNKILTLLVSGEPREVFPEALCYEDVDITLENGDVVKQRKEIEPLAANVVAENTKKSLHKLKTEFLRIVAPILGCSYDDLYQRHHRRLVKTIAMAAAIVLLIVISFSLYVMNNAAIQKRQAEEITNTNAQLEKKNEELEKKNEELDKKNEELDRQIIETKKQTELAILEKKNAQERQLFRTLYYAQQVLDSGDRLQAAAILTQAYEKFPQDSDLFDEFKSRLEVAMAEAAYYPEFSTYTILKQNGSVDHIVFSKDSSAIAATSEKKVAIWDIETLEKTLEVEHDSPVSCSLFLKDYLITGTTDGYIYVWDLQTGSLRQKLDNDYIREISNNKSNHDERIEKITYNEVLNAIVYTYRCDGYPPNTCVTICPFDTTGTGKVLTLGQMIYSDSPIALSDNGRFAAVGTAVTDYPYDSADIYCYDLNKFDLQKTVNDNMDANGIWLDCFDQRIYSYAIKDDGTLYVNVKKDQGSGSLIYVYDVENDTFLLPMSEAYSWYDDRDSVAIGYFEDIFFPNEYNGNMIHASDSEIHFIEQEDDRYILRETFYASDYHNIYSTNQEADVIYAPNDAYALLIFDANEDSVCVYDTKAKVCKELHKPTGNLLSLAIADNGNLFAVGTDAGNVMLYRKEASGVPAEKISMSLERRNALSSTGLVLTQGGGNGEPTDVSVYDINANADIAKLQMTTNNSCITDEDFVFNAEGTFVLGSEVSYSDKKTYLRIWDPRTGAVINRLELINSKISNHTDLIAYNLGETSRYIAAAIKDALYVYDMLSDEFVFEEKYEGNGRIQIFINDAHGIIRIVDLIGGTITEINIDNGIGKQLGYINYYGARINAKGMDFESNRLLLQQYVGAEIANEFCVYSISEMQRLFNITEINLCTDPFWAVNNEGTYAVSGGWGDGANLFQIPTFEDIVAQTKNLAGNRILSDEERRSCMLDIFD